MPVSLYLGPYQPFLEEELLSSFLTFREADPFSPVTVLVPNFLLVGHLRRALAERDGKLFNLQVHTLRHYLESYVEEAVVREDLKNLPDVLAPWILKEVARPVLSKGSAFRPVMETPGFYPSLRSTLGELREGLYTPEMLKALAKSYQKAVNTQRLAQKLSEFAEVSDAYGEWKKKGRWLDREDSYFKALEVPSPAEGRVWIYGFYDASALQKKVLQHLAGGESHWFIPYEDHPAFEYAKPFVDWAEGLGEVQKEDSWKPGGKSPLQRLQGILFHGKTPWMDHFGKAPEIKPEDYGKSDCKILLCPGEPREVREVARALFEEVDQRNCNLSDCAVVLRDPAGYRKILPPVFEAQGIPVSKSIPGPLLETMEAKALLLMLDCFLEDFPRDAVMDLLSCPILQPSTFKLKPEEWNPSYWDVLSREARVVEGEKEWIGRLTSWRALKQKESKEEDETTSHDQEIRSSVAFEKVLAWLFEAGRELEKAKGWPEKSAKLLERFKNLCAPSDLSGVALAKPEALQETVGALESFALLSKSFRLDLSNEDFRSLLAALLEERKVKAKGLQPGGVQVVDLMQARGVPFDVLALPGLVEKSIPRLVRQDPLLLDDERVLLNTKAEGAEIPLKQSGMLEERLLFTLTVRSAKKAILLTAPHLNPSTGSPRTPSIYLFESAEAVLGKRITRLGDAPGLVKAVLVNDWIQPDFARCADPLETLLTAVELGRRGDLASALAVVRDKPFYFDGCNLLKFRQAARVFTAYDGMLQGVEARQRLQQGYSLKDKRLSASRLETFAACPLRYFYKYVLGLTVTPEPEKVLELQASDRGNLMHDILEQTLKQGLKDGWLKTADGKEAQKALGEEMEKAFRRFEREGVPGAPALWAWEKDQMARDLSSVVEEVLQNNEWTPLDFEVAFGDGKGKNDIAFGAFHLQGRMDRVDISRDGSRLRVVDYKSGSSTGVAKDSVKAGTKLQLPFYLWALQNLFPEKQAKEALYDYITRKGGYRQVSFTPETPDQIHDILSQVLATVDGSVEEGSFPAVGQECEFCDYQRLCGTGMKERGKRKREDEKVGNYFKLEDLP
jgi:RecB family exonuclease